MEDLPEEILEIVFSFLSPYQEYNIASCVCKKWQRILCGMLKQLPHKFERNLIDGAIDWYRVDEGDQVTTVIARTGQAACYSDFMQSMYIFGGRSVASFGAGFNDLLRLDLNSLTWNHPTVKQNIPPPKFGCSFESYKHYLILFGGSSLPPTNTLSRGNAEFNNDLHIFDITSGSWTHKPFLSDDCPPELYLPQTCILSNDLDPDLDIMVLYGGRKMALLNQANKDMWCLHLDSWTWQKQVLVGGSSPDSFMETSNAVICQFKSSTYSTALLALGQTPRVSCVWLLYKTGFAEWTWKKIKIASGKYAPFLNAHQSMPHVQIGQKLLLFGNACAESCKPAPSKVPVLKVLHSNVKSKSAKSTSYVRHPRIIRNIPHNPLLNIPMAPDSAEHETLRLTFKGLFMYILDLQNIEIEGIGKWVDQLNPVDQKLLPSFVGMNVAPNGTVVLGKGEIILHGPLKMGKNTVMQLCIIRNRM